MGAESSGADDLALREKFARVAQAALRAASTLLPQWVGGKRIGNEWVAARRADGGPGDSWSINLTTGVWSHFASGIKGHDIIGYYAELHHISQGAAMRQIAQQLGMDQDRVPVLPPAYTPRAAPEEPEEPSSDPIPFDAPDLRPHPIHGAATATYRYGDKLIVTRYDFTGPDGKPAKLFSQWTWRNGNWVNRGYGDNRPLFHVEQLALSPGAKVLVVEGEKCVEISQPLLRAYVVVTWSGGAASWRKTEWSPLKGREVHIWPDADTAGRQCAADLAAYLAPIASSVRVINPNGADPGWDIADAINRDGWDGNRITDFVKEHIEEPIKPVSPPTKGEISENLSTPRAEATSESSALVNWAAMGLDCDTNKQPYVTLSNASKILRRHEKFKDHIWFDDFRGNIYHTLRGTAPQRWTDAETRALTAQIQESLRLNKFTTRIVDEGLRHAAECNRRNSLHEYLNSLRWDGNERLETWLVDCAGVESNEYTQAVGRNWLIGMIARAYRPGCKMDNMPVLEGVSGLRKTQFLETLGGAWYKALTMQFGEKDFLQTLRGAWLIEIPDMTGFTRADHGKVVATLSTPVDSYRVPYGREPEDVPRTCVFAATSETDDYLADSRGKRRYWPLKCTDINLDTLRQQRDNLFAEAIVKYRDGAKWYEMPAELTEREQSARSRPDPWDDIVLDGVEAWWQRDRDQPDFKGIMMKDILRLIIAKESSQQTEFDVRRIATILRANGWHQKRDSGHRWWRKRGY